eukprot:scaffold706_cov418-Prasinococcus_capsulatus_cf.AAC.31
MWTARCSMSNCTATGTKAVQFTGDAVNACQVQPMGILASMGSAPPPRGAGKAALTSASRHYD